MASPVSAYHSAMSLLSQNKFSDGATALQAVIERGGLPKELMPDAKANLGTALSAMGRHDEAVIPFRSAVNMRPTNGQYRYNIALSFAEMGNAASAETEYREAARLGPKETAASAYNNLGNMLVTSGRRDGAIELFRSAVQMNPQNAMGHNNLANLLRDGGDAASLRAAGRHYSSAIQLSPRYLEAYKNLGNLLKERQEWRYHAARAYRIALQLVPESSREVRQSLLLNLGEVCQWLGKDRAANATFAYGVNQNIWQHAQQRPSHLKMGLAAKPWWDLESILHPTVKRKLLSPSFIQTLRREGLALLERGTSTNGMKDRFRYGKGGDGASSSAQDGFRPYYSAALASGNWTDVTLALSGIRQPGAALAPESYALYESLGEVATTMVMGSAYFSVLSPGARLRAHCGPTNVRLRIHIGLSVSSSYEQAMRVGNETREWIQDGAIAFDDSFEHEVWNNATTPRLVFILDVWHPQLVSDQERLSALDQTGKSRYARTAQSIRDGYGLPDDNKDALADRRVKVIY